ncbi:MAG: hypothetical protein HGA90_00235, partial [Alphaproteobacteria bacterium]|nr:hypothetical protein [Alphaproteobacteria bacterium]
MLQVMRDMSKSWIFKGLMLLLIVSFGIWGIGDMFRGNPQQRTVAEVGKVGISVMELESNFRATLPEARRVFGPELTDQQAREKGVLDRTLYILIEHATFNQEAKRLGLDVSDKVILSKVAANPKFRDRDGKFDMQLWRRALGKTGISERYFMDEERHQEARGLIFNALKNDLKTPQTLVDYLYRARGAKRILEVLTLAHANMNGVPAPDEAALKTFHEDHGDLFAAPETRAMTIAKLASDDAIKGLELSEEDLKNAYDSRSAELTRPEQRDLTQAVVSDEDKAKAIAEAAKTGTPLSVAAKAKGASAVDLKGVDEKSILPELYTSVFAMEEGQIEGPLKSPLGWHVVQLRKVHPSGKPSFDEVKKELRESLQKERAADAVARAVNQLDDALAAGKALEDIADGLSLRLIKIPALEANGKTPDGKDPGELPAKNDVLKVAFNQGAGETSSIIDDSQTMYVFYGPFTAGVITASAADVWIPVEAT